MDGIFGRLSIFLSFVFRDVRKNRIVLLFTVISLGTAFATVFLSAGILEGFQSMLKGGAVDSMGEIVIYPKDGNAHIDNVGEVTRMIESIGGVSGVSVKDKGEAIVRYGKMTIGPYTLMGIDEQRESTVTKLPGDVIDGSFLASGDTGHVVLGRTLADALVDLEYDDRRIPIGASIDLISDFGQSRTYTVSGIIDGKTFTPNWNIYLDKGEADNFIPQMKDSQISVKLVDPLAIENTKRLLQQRNLDIQVATWRDESGYIADIMAATELITGSMSKLLMLAVFVIMNVIIFINVFQRRRQIGILKSMGASTDFVVLLYVAESFIYSMISFAIGFFIFFLIHVYSNLYPINTLMGYFHTVLNAGNLISSLAILVVASVGGSLFPAVVAARTNIADIVRSNV